MVAPVGPWQFSGPEPVCPDWLLGMAAGRERLRTLVAGADSQSALEGARNATRAGLIEPLFVGNGPRVRELADKLEWDIGAFDLVDVDGDHPVAGAVSRAAADPAIGAIMKGHVHTDALMAALVSRRDGIRTHRRMTHAFLMSGPGIRPFILSDAALNILPDIKTKKAVIENAVGLARAIGIARPHVALLSATESVLAHMPSSVEAEELTDWAGRSLPGTTVFGPLAMDIVVSAEIARAKGIDHPVAGHADIVVVPNIECGNALFKMMVHYLGACGAGLVLGGRIPVMLTSRTDHPQARLASAALAVLSGTGNGDPPGSPG